jgi:hypothetical protein
MTHRWVAASCVPIGPNAPVECRLHRLRRGEPSLRVPSHKNPRARRTVRWPGECGARFQAVRLSVVYDGTWPFPIRTTVTTSLLRQKASTLQCTVIASGKPQLPASAVAHGFVRSCPAGAHRGFSLSLSQTPLEGGVNSQHFIFRPSSAEHGNHLMPASCCVRHCSSARTMREHMDACERRYLQAKTTAVASKATQCFLSWRPPCVFRLDGSAQRRAPPRSPASRRARLAPLPQRVRALRTLAHCATGLLPR